MAIWQFDFYFVPTDAIRQHHGGVPELLEDFIPQIDVDAIDLEADEINYWHKTEVTKQTLAAIARMLPETKSWDDSARMFGKSDGDKVEVWEDTFLCRIDMRQFNRDTLGQLLDIGADIGCSVVVKESGKVVTANVWSVLPEIDASVARRFVIDPERCLRSLGHNRDIENEDV